MKNIMEMFDEEWERLAVEAERECGGILAGRLGSPDDRPMEPVLEDEATLRRILSEKAELMRQKEAARKKFLHEYNPPTSGVSQ